MTQSNNYYFWLIEQIKHYEYDVECYQQVLEKLFNSEFYSILHRDENRVADGMSLYSEYTNSNGIPFNGPYIDAPPNDFCSILEMMIALARRIEFELMYDPDEGDRTSEWFWLMMDNLGLTKMDDDNYDPVEVERILYLFLERKYERNGVGGLFRTHNNCVDMREMEIWYQMSCYFDEYFS